MATLAEFKARLLQLRSSDPYIEVRATGECVCLRTDVPKTRTDCPASRPCPHVRCAWHLWRTDAEDRAGNPNSGNGPGTTLRPAWLEVPLPPSCALDIAERGGASVQEIASALDMHRGNVWLIWKRSHVRAAFEELREVLQIGGGE